MPLSRMPSGWSSRCHTTPHAPGRCFVRRFLLKPVPKRRRGALPSAPGRHLPAAPHSSPAALPGPAGRPSPRLGHFSPAPGSPPGTALPRRAATGQGGRRAPPGAGPSAGIRSRLRLQVPGMPAPGPPAPSGAPIVLQPERTAPRSARARSLPPPLRLPSGPVHSSARRPAEGPIRGKREGPARLGEAKSGTEFSPEAGLGADERGGRPIG